MTERARLEVDTLTIRIPVRLQRRGGRKLIMAPEGSVMATPKPRRDDTLIKALVRAHRWRRKIESGRAESITDLAEQEGMTDAYVCRLLPLTWLGEDDEDDGDEGDEEEALRGLLIGALLRRRPVLRRLRRPVASTAPAPAAPPKIREAEVTVHQRAITRGVKPWKLRIS